MVSFPGYNLVKQHLLSRNSTTSTNTVKDLSKTRTRRKKNLNVHFAPERNNNDNNRKENYDYINKNMEASVNALSSFDNHNINGNNNTTFAVFLTTIYHVERFTNRDDNVTRQELWYSTHEEMNFRQRDEQMKHLLQDGMDLAQVELKIKLMAKMKQKQKKQQQERRNSISKDQQTNKNQSQQDDGGDDSNSFSDYNDYDEYEDDDDDSPRGLEYAQPEYSKQTEERRKNAKNAVMATQRLFQKREQPSNKEGRGGTESIARVYNLCCEASKQDAIDIAQRDYQFVIDHVIAVKNDNNDSRSRRQSKMDPLTGRIILLEKQRSERPALLIRQGVTSVQ